MDLRVRRRRHHTDVRDHVIRHAVVQSLRDLIHPFLSCSQLNPSTAGMIFSILC